ncbi:SigE family RNA polymerase sigma factor [Kitasatospora sp. NBC_01287]|uniref:SigE family RNA polymerase sigma factor n=1 Tax=Kitasatospora sp. NBC_01287 TaxID=2903573 RepID=UPI00224E2518|nr:SigE family RNA polymerase sigma factor [Kitasatospora sp. NBC_01287]MCX4749735.1 SigE family RNA polymerase sigma factor [Kitasatospora sp. NBC_01287]
MNEVLSFEEFASSRARRLFQVAYLTCGDWHQAQDLVQTTLAKLYVAWGRLQRSGQEVEIDAYARKVLVNSYLSHRRLRRSGELAVGELPEKPAGEHGGGTELRLTLLSALRLLPPRSRAAVVLRYLEDYSIEAVAEVLGSSPNAVKSLNSRSLARLRELLGDDRELLFRTGA